MILSWFWLQSTFCNICRLLKSIRVRLLLEQLTVVRLLEPEKSSDERLLYEQSTVESAPQFVIFNTDILLPLHEK